MKRSNGVSLITLIVTIMVMFILIIVVGKYTIDNVREANRASELREVAQVREFVIDRQARLDTDEIASILSSHSSLLLTTAQADTVAKGKLTDSEISEIMNVNSADMHAKYKYFYLPKSGNYFEDSEFAAGGITVKDVKNDYIVNFFTGTIICLSDENFTVDGVIKGLTQIQSESTIVY
ncbi:MAG: type II secretion system protein [Clostridia bacterium]|nr:type II secretion system protein [Clostridia bacterium]